MISHSFTGRRERIIRWWAKRQGKSVEEVVADVFDSHFRIVDGEFDREEQHGHIGKRAPAKRARPRKTGRRTKG